MYISKEKLEELRQIDAYSYLTQREPHELMPCGHNRFRLKSEHSCVVTPRGWYAWGRGTGGKSAIDFLVVVKGLSLLDASEVVGGTKVIEWTQGSRDESQGDMILPPHTREKDKAKAYLLGRGLDEEIIDFCFKKNLIYQEAKYGSLVFVGYDNDGDAKYAFVRGTYKGSMFRQEPRYSQKKYSFRITKPNNKILNIFESAIDALSFASLLKASGKNWQSQNYLSLSGVYQKGKGKTPLEQYPALQRYLDEFPETKQINICLDNDWLGQEASQSLLLALEDKCEVNIYLPPKVKDWNDYLKQKQKSILIGR